jgi:nucleotide-binding universal stress UspA family protein
MVMQTLLIGKRVALKNILFLTDFSEPSVTALPFAAMIARAYEAKVTALHVLLPSVYTYMTPGMAGSLLDGEADVAKTEMSCVEAGLMGLPHETMIERNIGVWPVLSKKLEEGDIDLIVMGTHGRTGLNKAVFGSSAEEVFRRANVPVLTIGPAVRTGSHNGGRFQCVLFATDFNAVSNTAAAYAASLAQENQSRLILLHVLPAPKGGKANKTADLSVAEALHRVENLLPRNAEQWCRPEPMVEHGEPGAQILAVADRCGADLIVLGVRGMDLLTGIATRVERATAYEVAAHAHCPVLTVRGS